MSTDDPNRLEFVASFYQDSLSRDRGQFVGDLKRAAEALDRIAGQADEKIASGQKLSGDLHRLMVDLQDALHRASRMEGQTEMFRMFVGKGE